MLLSQDNYGKAMSYADTLKLFKKKSLKELLPPPVKAEHGEYSMILSLMDKPALMTKELFQVSLKAIEYAYQVDFGELCSRNSQAETYANLWPGEHYRLLAGFVLAIQPKVVVEIGTSTGLSALCLKQYLPSDGQVVSFDIVPWESYPATLLRKEDLDGRLIQHVDDLSDASVMQRYRSLMEEAEFIFIDVSHDGDLEERILSNLQKMRFNHKVFMLLDDIRVWTMLKFWRNINLPKIDLTSFGHWSGTGIVELN